jgi:hypothetical protein
MGPSGEEATVRSHGGNAEARAEIIRGSRRKRDSLFGCKTVHWAAVPHCRRQAPRLQTRRTHSDHAAARVTVSPPSRRTHRTLNGQELIAVATVVKGLEDDPEIVATHISVTALDGAIALGGHVATYHQKHVAVRVAERVPAER